jgi:hypothetical protein
MLLLTKETPLQIWPQENGNLAASLHHAELPEVKERQEQTEVGGVQDWTHGSTRGHNGLLRGQHGNTKRTKRMPMSVREQIKMQTPLLQIPLREKERL